MRKLVFKDLKGVLLESSPSPGDVLFGEVVEGSSQFGEVFDESTIEVGESQKAS
jgi:hypothetical protein